MQTRASAVFLWDERALFVGDRSTTGQHSHFAMEISIALDSAGLDVAIPAGAGHRSAPGVVVRSSQLHRLSVPGPKVAVWYLDPTCRHGRALAVWLGPNPCRSLPASAVDGVRESTLALLDATAGLAQAERTWEQLLGSLLEPLAGLNPTGSRTRVDPRVAHVVALIEQRIDNPPNLAELAESVHLSPDRLRILFSQELGLPMRRFVLWSRLRRALTGCLHGSSMTDAAYAAGFADAAHFSRTCRSMFGLPASAFAPVDAVFTSQP